MIHEALAKAQGKLSNPTRNRTVKVASTRGSYSFEYATYDHILDTIRPVLDEFGLGLTQGVEIIEGEQWLVTNLVKDNERIGNMVKVILPTATDRDGQPKTISPQEYGSSLTYARRYGLCLLLNIASEEDDDGNSAAGNAMKDIKQVPFPEPGVLCELTGVLEDFEATARGKAQVYLWHIEGAPGGKPIETWAMPKKDWKSEVGKKVKCTFILEVNGAYKNLKAQSVELAE